MLSTNNHGNGPRILGSGPLNASSRMPRSSWYKGHQVVGDSTGRAELAVEAAWISPASTADVSLATWAEQLTSTGGGYPVREMRP